jgi:hypothetical protein
MNDANQTSPLILGLYDTISVLVPGTVFWLIIYLTSSTKLSVTPDLLIPAGLILGVTTGYIFLALGNFLFGCYIHPRNYKNRVVIFATNIIHKSVKFIIREHYGNKGIDLRGATIDMLKKKYNIKTEIDDLGLFQLCDTLASKEKVRNDRDVLLAKEGIFRSISALLFVTMGYYYIFLRYSPLDLWLLIIFVILERLCIYGNNYFKKIRQSQVYVAAYLSLKEVKHGRA